MSTLPGRARRRVTPLAFLAAVAAALMAVSPVMADTVVKHHGKTGVGTIEEGLNGVVCHYDEVALSLLSIEISGPTVFARNRTAQPDDSQMIGWQVFVKRTGGGLPADVDKSVVQKAQSFEHLAPAFNPFRYDLDSQPPATAKFTVFVKLFWYKPNGRTVEGWSKHRVDNYTWATPTFTGEYPAPACAGHWG